MTIDRNELKKVHLSIQRMKLNIAIGLIAEAKKLQEVFKQQMEYVEMLSRSFDTMDDPQQKEALFQELSERTTMLEMIHADYTNKIASAQSLRHELSI